MMLPGSTQVDRGLNDVMEDCTAQSCPYGLPMVGDSTTSGSWARALLSALSSGGSDSGGIINVAPLMYGNLVGGVNAGAPAAARSAATQLLMFLASKEVQEELAGNMQSGA